MDKLLEQMTGLFEKRVNLLIVDDERHVLKSLERNFTSPAFKTTAIDSYPQTIRALAGSTTPWHCWVLDIDLGNNQTCLEIMKAFPNYPFVIILSGLHSMHLAAEAVKLGAIDVFDKDPSSLDRFYNQICKLSALGYLLGGKRTQYLPLFRLLCASTITSIEEWAEKACVSVRQLHRITEIHPIKTPRASIALYYGLYYLLFKGKPPFNEVTMPGYSPESEEFFGDCVSYCCKNFNSMYTG